MGKIYNFFNHQLASLCFGYVMHRWTLLSVSLYRADAVKLNELKPATWEPFENWLEFGGQRARSRHVLPFLIISQIFVICAGFLSFLFLF